MIQNKLNITILTNMYPSENDVAWRGVFIKEQVVALKNIYDLVMNVCHIKGPVTRGGSLLNYAKWIVIFPFYVFKNKIKIVHSHHFLCTFIARLCFRCKLIYTVHEGELQEASLRSRLIELAISMSNTVIYVNHATYEKSNHCNKYFLPCGINLDIFNVVDKSYARETLGLLSEKVYILFPSSPLRKEKNANFLSDFLSFHAEFVNKNNIDILWGGEIDYSDMSLYMNAADIMVSFSDYESDGMVFKEAMACNLPVITFDVGNSQLYFGDGVAGSIIEKSMIQLKNEIIRWMDNPTNKSLGRDKIKKIKMDNVEVSSKLIEIYKNI